MITHHAQKNGTLRHWQNDRIKLKRSVENKSALNVQLHGMVVRPRRKSLFAASTSTLAETAI